MVMTKANELYAQQLAKFNAEFGLLNVRVYSAIPLTPDQKKHLESKLEKMFGKRIGMEVSVDTSLIGGMRIIAEHTVIDNSIKSMLAEMKKTLYREVFFK
jgi:F-type H+-transporting ATPase subunit delta